jgi:hypothetical protein
MIPVGNKTSRDALFIVLGPVLSKLYDTENRTLGVPSKYKLFADSLLRKKVLIFSKKYLKKIIFPVN